MAPVALAALADGALAALAALAPAWTCATSGAALLGERARLLALPRQGAVSPGGGCRLLPAADGWIAASLVRAEDWEAAPAWLEAAARDWVEVAEVARRRPAAKLVARARLLGLAVAPALPARPAPPGWVDVRRLGPPAAGGAGRPLRIVDLSTLWAGPLCTRLLAFAGAQVVKVESPRRPDGARRGPPALFDRLNAAKRSVALDLADPAGGAALRALVEGADMVVESARPRALRQLGLDAEALVAERPGLTWLSLTGYGREPPHDMAVAFGDDAAAAAGLVARMAAAHGEPLFCGDAVADPLAGVHAALAGLAAHQAGGGRLVSLSLHGVAAHASRADPAGAEGEGARTARWTALAGADPAPPDPLPPAPGPAPALGADTADVLADWR